MNALDNKSSIISSTLCGTQSAPQITPGHTYTNTSKKSHGQSCVTESALIRSRLRASYRKNFAKVEYRKTIGPEPTSSGL